MMKSKEVLLDTVWDAQFLRDYLNSYDIKHRQLIKKIKAQSDINISDSLCTMILNGYRKPTDAQLLAIIQALQFNEDYIAQLRENNTTVENALYRLDKGFI